MVTITCLVAVPVIGAMIPSLKPTRFSAEGVYKLLFIPPFVGCWWIAIRTADTVRARGRFYSGFLQSILLVLLIYREYDIRLHRSVFGVSGLDPPAHIATLWCIVIVGYTAAFSLLTPRLRRILDRSEPGKATCRRCGYRLRGLTVPRCPECGTPFEAALLGDEKRASTGSEP